MCGIAGIFTHQSQPAADVDALQRVSAYMAARGPDGDGQWCNEDNSLAFAHRRLAIIDLSAAATQPMLDVDKRYVITFNGEIYNHAELRLVCQQRGYEFATNSDTEVLLALYSYYQADMLQYLRGMFAFALYDIEQRVLLLARDPYGIKPLYYSCDSNELWFASSLRALQAKGGIETSSPDHAAMVGFLQTGSVPEPNSWHSNVQQLPAGSYVQLRQEQLLNLDEYAQPISYWQFSDVAYKPISEPNLSVKEQVHDAVQASVHAHLVADVPVGLFLSAGIDSAVLATLMRQCTNQPLTAVTLRFDEFVGTANDESSIAQTIAQRHGFKHQVYTVDRDEFYRELPKFFAAMEQPTIDALNTWFVAKAASELGLKVALSGIGGDELFGGYPSFQRIPKLLMVGRRLGLGGDEPRSENSRANKPNLLQRLLSFALRCAAKVTNNHAVQKWSALPYYIGEIGRAYQLQRSVYLLDEIPALLQAGDAQSETVTVGDDISGQNISALLKSLPKQLDLRRKVTILESACYLCNQLLRDADWAGMAHSVEIRTPFVDHRLYQKLAKVDDDYLYQSGKGALAALLTPADFELLARRPKTGFTLPMKDWLASVLSEQMPELVGALDQHWSRIYARYVAQRFLTPENNRQKRG